MQVVLQQRVLEPMSFDSVGIERLIINGEKLINKDTNEPSLTWLIFCMGVDLLRIMNSQC